MVIENDITPIQQYSYTTGKNATDSAMIIDAMDILYTGRVDGFCIISSDSDFTRLALRLREGGMQVIGMGQKKTPAPFIAACNKFIYIEILGRKRDEPKEGDKKEEIESPVEETVKKVDQKTVNLVSSSINDVADESGWAFLGDVGSLILKKQPDFDSRNYGFKKLAPLIKSIGAFEIDERQTDKGNIKRVYIKIKAKDKKRPSKKSVPKDNPEQKNPAQ